MRFPRPPLLGFLVAAPTVDCNQLHESFAFPGEGEVRFKRSLFADLLLTRETPPLRMPRSLLAPAPGAVDLPCSWTCPPLRPLRNSDTEGFADLSARIPPLSPAEPLTLCLPGLPTSLVSEADSTYAIPPSLFPPPFNSFPSSCTTLCPSLPVVGAAAISPSPTQCKYQFFQISFFPFWSIFPLKASADRPSVKAAARLRLVCPFFPFWVPPLGL